MKMVPIAFPVDFDQNEPGPLHLGRLYLGEDQEFVARLFFNTSGHLCIAVPSGAVKSGAVVVIPDPSPGTLHGL
jgi:hypothetical protein